MPRGRGVCVLVRMPPPSCFVLNIGTPMSLIDFTNSKRRGADMLARSALRVPVLEKIIAIGCRRSSLLKLGLGAVAHGYARVLRGREHRVAVLGNYRLWVNVAEPLGLEPFFFEHTGASWLTPSLIPEADIFPEARPTAR